MFAVPEGIHDLGMDHDKHIPIILVQHTNYQFSFRNADEFVAPTLFIRSHEYRHVSSEQLDVIKQSTGQEVQAILSHIWYGR